MTKEYNTVLTDEILHFLYRSASFQALEEQEQQLFLKQFGHNPLFKEMVDISIALEETITEVEATMPKIQDRDFLLPEEQQKQLLKNRTIISGNVMYVPFEERGKLYSPMIIVLQQSQSMEKFETFCKGMVMPLFHLCAVQRRDLIIIPFHNRVEKPLYFKNGALETALFEEFLQSNIKKEARIVPVIEKSLAIFGEDAINNQRDLMIITDNQFTDFHTLLQQDYTERIRELAIDVSIIAISEGNFQVQPIPFADKVFFAND